MKKVLLVVGLFFASPLRLLYD